MPSQRILKSVLHNLIDTFTSRNADFDGYWLHGLLLIGLDELRIDLLSLQGASPGRSPIAYACRLAGQQFREQMAKGNLDVSRLAEAVLTVRRRDEPKRFWSGQPRDGSIVV